jgi:hypothetical protein
MRWNTIERQMARIQSDRLMAHAAESVETRAPNCKMGKMTTEVDFGCLRSYLMILFKQTSTKRHEDPGNKSRGIMGLRQEL